LSDTDTANVTGAELVTNGTFASNVSGWTSQLSAVLTHTGSGISVQSTGGNSLAYQFLTLDSAKDYVGTITLVSGAGSINAGGVSTALSVGENTFQMPASRNNNKLDLTPNTSTTAVFDNISVRLAEADRSVNGNGLQVFGTVTKTAVATGADLVGYSGFSTSNYLQQPYNSAIEVGTGNFCSMGWYYSASGSIGAREYIVNCDGGAGTSLFTKEYTNVFQFLGTNGSTVVSAGQWYFYCGVVSGGQKSLYVNGKIDVTAASTSDINDNSDGLRIGSHTGNSGWNLRGSLALYRFSATAPSPEQIAKIYNDEKHLFQAGAQATLYGDSDAVTALAHDDTTELLHVGTSAGRSVFQGLRRVENTTDAITAAISASNGLVAEE
jgi:hypothetical protein